MDSKQDQHTFKTPVSHQREKRSVVSGENGDSPAMKVFASTPTKTPAKLVIPPSPFLAKLGYGTGVNVYLLDRKTTGKPNQSPWAVKKCSSKANSATRKQMQCRIEHEAVILKDLDHENIIGYRNTLRDENGMICLCMEKSEKSLRDLIEKRRGTNFQPFQPHIIHKVISCVSSALHYLHSEKLILHGDIKSDNILITGDFDKVQLCDFGVCLKLNSELSVPKSEEEFEYQPYIGTRPWCCWEVLETDQCDSSADIYALGCVIYEMLSLSIPHLLDYNDSDDDEQEECSIDEDGFLSTLGHVPNLPDLDYNSTHHPYIVLMNMCCREANKRPSAAVLVNTLKALEEQKISE